MFITFTRKYFNLQINNSPPKTMYQHNGEILHEFQNAKQRSLKPRWHYQSRHKTATVGRGGRYENLGKPPKTVSMLRQHRRFSS